MKWMPSLKWDRMPTVVFYTPIITYALCLCIKKRCSPAIIMAANPVFKHGGLPFESKASMHEGIDRVLPYLLVDVGEYNDEVAREVDKRIGYPAIVKPDTGHRGLGVRKANNPEELASMLSEAKWPMLVQSYSDLALEYGVFYHREPGKEEGDIVSLTRKEIPADSGMISASHCRGAHFSDARELNTPELRASLNELFKGKAYYFGRLDVKASSDDALRQGEFEIIEVNGASSEFIHIFDDANSWKDARQELHRQWRLLIDVGIKAKRLHGTQHTTFDMLSRYVRFFYDSKKAEGSIW